MIGRPPERADVIIVGAGAAGAVIAARLSEDSRRTVALVEAGGSVDDPAMRDPLAWPTLEGKPYDYGYRTVPQSGTAGRSHAWPRGRGLGGSTLIHAMAHVRGHVEDFDRWGAMAGPLWTSETLRDGFNRVEEAYAGARTRAGDAGLEEGLLQPCSDRVHPLALDFIASARTLGAPPIPTHNAGPMIGATANTLLIAGGERITVADAYFHRARQRPNLHVLPQTAAVAVTFDNDHSPPRATGVLVQGPEGQVAICADSVVVCAGAIDTPLLLMRSGIGDGAILSALGLPVRVARPAVGTNLQDHVFGAGAVYQTRAPLAPSRLQHSEALLYAGSGANDRWQDRAPDCVVACVVAGVVAPGLPSPPAASFTLLFGITHPTSRGTVRPTAPTLGAVPLIDPNYLATEADRFGMVAAFRLARELADTDPLAKWIARELVPGEILDDPASVAAFVERALITHHHPAGTCRMGLDGDAVVSPDLTVRGTDRLHVCDASVFPDLPSGPINAAVSAVAETFASRFDA